jgi:hypothetical protein
MGYFTISEKPDGMSDYEGDTKERCVLSAKKHLSKNDLNYSGHLNEYDSDDNFIQSEAWEANYDNTSSYADYVYETNRENAMEGY